MLVCVGRNGLGGSLCVEFFTDYWKHWSENKNISQLLSSELSFAGFQNSICQSDHRFTQWALMQRSHDNWSRSRALFHQQNVLEVSWDWDSFDRTPVRLHSTDHSRQEAPAQTPSHPPKIRKKSANTNKNKKETCLYRDFTVKKKNVEGKTNYLLCPLDAPQQTHCQLESTVRGWRMKPAADRPQALWKFRVMPSFVHWLYTALPLEWCVAKLSNTSSCKWCVVALKCSKKLTKEAKFHMQTGGTIGPTLGSSLNHFKATIMEKSVVYSVAGAGL